MRVVGLTGAAGSGKSTVARHLVTRFGAVPLALADYFKIPAVVHGALPMAEVFGPTPKSVGTRRFLQRRGTEEGRDVYGENLWVDHLLTHLYRLAQMGVTRVVVDDVRFPNEAHALRTPHLVRGDGWTMRPSTHVGLGFLGEVWQVTGRSEGLMGDAAAHASEVPIAPTLVDLTVPNRFSAAMLSATVDHAVRCRLDWRAIG